MIGAHRWVAVGLAVALCAQGTRARADDAPAPAPGADDEPVIMEDEPVIMDDDAPEATPAPAPSAAPSPAPAASGDDDEVSFSEDEAGAGAHSGPPRLFIHVFDDAKVGAEALEGTLRGARAAFAGDTRVVLVDVDGYLHDVDAEKTALAEADAAVDAANTQIMNLDLDAALVAVRKAVDSYEHYLPQLRERDGNLGRLTNAHRLLANASFLNQDTDAAMVSLHRMFVLRPDLTYKRALFPPQMEQLVNAEQARMAALPRGSLDLDSLPRRAQLLVNGQPVGVAPQSVPDLVPGPNYVTALMPGHPPTTVIVEVEPGPVITSAKIPLEAYPDDPFAKLAAARPEVGGVGIGPRLSAAAARLGKPELLLLIVPEAGENLMLAGYLYDTRSGRLIGKARGESDPAYPGPPAEALARTLTRDVPLDGGAGAVVEPMVVKRKSGPGALTRFRRSRWFWPVVGGAAGVVVLSVVIGVASASADADSRARFVVLNVLSKSF